MYIKVLNYGFQVLNPTTKKATALVNAFILSNHNNKSLYDVYEKPSYKKSNALDFCKRMKMDLGGINEHITSFNTFSFCYGFTFICDNKLSLAYITPYNNYLIPLEK